MFANLTNFSYKRTAKEAIVFYLAYLVLGFILGAVAGALGAVILAKGGSETEVYSAAAQSGMVVAILYPMVISFLILKGKNLTSNFGYILLAVAAGILGYFGGALLGLIPAAFLTTKK